MHDIIDTAVSAGKFQTLAAALAAAKLADTLKGPGPFTVFAPTDEAFAKLPGAAKAKAREKTLLVLSKANSRATVHRPAYLDYVGIKTFDSTGQVVGERRFLGLFSSAAYTESVLRIPLLREKSREVLKRAVFDPRSHAGKALMDTLENFPRDELFHTLDCTDDGACWAAGGSGRVGTL